MKTLVKYHRRAVGYRAIQRFGSRPEIAEGGAEKAAADYRALLGMGLGVGANGGNHFLRTHVRAQNSRVDIGQSVTHMHVGVDKAGQNQSPLQIAVTGIGTRQPLDRLATTHRHDAIASNRQAVRPGLPLIQGVNARVVENQLCSRGLFISHCC